MYTAKKLWFLCLSSLLLFMGMKCKKEYPFPDETQVGMNTFGCKVDGKVWVPGGRSFHGPELESSYNIDGARRAFSLHVVDNSSYDFTVISIGGDSIELVENSVYPLVKKGVGNYFGEYVLTTENSYTPFITSQISQGELWIKKFDIMNKIVSGTFWFTAIDPISGKKVEITDGRFDMKFNQ